MKKVFSLLLVVAMLVSLSLVASAAPANEAGGMHTVITETDTDITVDVYVANAIGCSSITSYIVTDAVTFVDGSAVVGDVFDGASVTPTTNKAGYIKFVLAHTDAANFFDTDEAVLALSYKVAKVDPAAELSEADFSYSTSTIKVSKVVTSSSGIVAGVAGGNNFTSAKQPAYFTIEYVDDREPESEFGASAAGTTITCFGKVDATVENYGVVFTADSTVEGARAQKYYGAMPGDTVKDYNGSTTFTFGDWDGTFEIILEGVHAGEKELNFFANDTIIPEANTFTLTVQ